MESKTKIWTALVVLTIAAAGLVGAAYAAITSTNVSDSGTAAETDHYYIVGYYDLDDVPADLETDAAAETLFQPITDADVQWELNTVGSSAGWKYTWAAQSESIMADATDDVYLAVYEVTKDGNSYDSDLVANSSVTLTIASSANWTGTIVVSYGASSTATFTYNNANTADQTISLGANGYVKITGITVGIAAQSTPVTTTPAQDLTFTLTTVYTEPAQA